MKVTSQHKLTSLLVLLLGIQNIVLFFMLSGSVIPVFSRKVQHITGVLHTGAPLGGIFNAQFLVVALLTLYWGALVTGFIFAFLRITLDVLKTRAFVRSLGAMTNESGILIFESEHPIVFTAGLLHPRIYMSEAMASLLSDQEMSAVIAHEEFHVRTYEPLRQCINRCIIYAIPLLPNPAKVEQKLQSLGEASADEYAQKELSTKRPIISAMIKIIESGLSVNLVVSQFAGENRIHSLTGGKVRSFATTFTLVVLSLVSMLIGYVLVGKDLITTCNITYY